MSFYLLISLLTEIIYPTTALALTSGPSAPEVDSFEPISTSDMVDIFTGDFKYNIPLLDVEGYPINIAYNSGISTDQEASWVGLGWNLNVGNINRGMRGIPDDFNGTDIVKKEYNMKENRTYGINAGVDFELFGKETKKKPGAKKKFNVVPRVGVGINYNNYTGFGMETSVGIGISAGVGGKGKLDAGLGLHSSTTGGLDISPNLSYSSKSDERIQGTDDRLVKSGGGAIGGTFNTRAGLKQLGFSANYQMSAERKGKAPLPPGSSFDAESSTRMGGSSGHSINFGLQTYVPHISMPMVTNAVSLSFKTSVHVFGCDGDLTIGGYYSCQKLAKNSSNMRAYGYLYSEVGQDDDEALMDFNREKDGSFSRFTKNLPISNFTYDVYSAVGQGVGGTFRPFRHDVGHLFDNSASSNSDSYSLGAEMGTGNLLKLGIDISLISVDNNTNKWSDKNKSIEYFKFRPKAANTGDESYYFRAVGEKIADNANMSLYNSLGGDDAYAIKLKQGLNATAMSNANSNSQFITAEKELIVADHASSSISLNGTNYHLNRQKRNQNFSILTASEAKNFGFQKNYYNGTGVTGINNNNPAIAYSSSSQFGHHIAEISVLNNEGGRYIYGLPVYNKLQKEVNFNCSGTSPSIDGLISYSSADASVNNTKGIDNSYGSTEVPSYAYSYLLTSVLSSDYVDVTGDGPTDDDLGNFTKFHYKKSNSSTGVDFKWRMPVNSGSSALANYNQGSKSKTKDQTANYTYGEKELWFLDEIVTKNFVAIFETSDREDALGVAGEHTGVTMTGARNKRLDKITLYTKRDYLYSPTTAVPVKVVHFVYDYSQCPGIPNSTNGGGKLTLKEVYFTYGKSDRARFNKFEFTYPLVSNALYAPKAYDRWGNYMQALADPAYLAYNSAVFSNSEFPYTNQNKAITDANAQKWTLNKIKLPSGAEIRITYESDDYAFIQNYPVGQMYSVVDATTSQPGVPSSNAMSSVATLFTKNGSSYSNNLYLVIDGIPSGISSSDFQKYYVRDMVNANKKLFFKFLVNLTKSSGATVAVPNFYEYVTGYAEIDNLNCGKIPGNNTQAWIKLKDVRVKRQNNGDFINPVALSAIQFGRLNYGEEVWDKIASPPADIEEALKQLAHEAFGSLKTLVEGFKNPNKALADKEYCSKFITHKSMIRLYEGTGKKLGGGCRVKEIEMVDNWSDMTLVGSGYQENSSYGQTYEYTDKDQYGRVISSGVASYEPFIGGEDNTMKQPKYFGKENKWAMSAPDDRYFTESPYGESFFPSPSVGYSKVKVTKKIYNNNGQTVPSNQKDGYKVFEFYTSKDYPTLTEETPIIPKQHRPPLGNLMPFSKDFIYTSQGYVVRTNDMHGKPKSELDFAEGKSEPMKEVRFFYKTRGGRYQEPTQRNNLLDASYNFNTLDNSCSVINTNGTVDTKVIGVDFDAVADFRESETRTINAGMQLNVGTFLVAAFPGVFPSVWPSFGKETSRFRSAVLTKVVNQYGILERTEVTENGTKVTSDNLAFDAETGDVLVTKTKNGFSDDVYSLKYPAHWGYDKMGHAYKNLGITVNAVLTSNGVSSVANASSFLNIGDEVGITTANSTVVAWVADVTSTTAKFLTSGTTLVTGSNTNSVVKVLRSARRNLIGAGMGSITSLVNPLQGANSTQPITISSSSKVLQASAVVYSDIRQLPLVCTYATGVQVNPFVKGIKGNWYEKSKYAFLTARQQTSSGSNANTDARQDGYFTTYSPIYVPPSSGNVWTFNSTNWTNASEVTKFNVYGKEVENKDAQGNYSSALFGFNESLPIAVAGNAQIREIAYDGFEDYGYYFPSTCQRQPHFKFVPDGSVVYGVAHTGKHSFRFSTGYSTIVRPVSLTPQANGVNTNYSNYQLSDFDFVYPFSPLSQVNSNGTEYVFSYWVKINNSTALDYNSCSINVGYGTANPLPILERKRSPIIDGWQRHEYRIIIPNSYTGNIVFDITNNTGTDVFFDDIRMHPAKSSMKTFAYDPFTLKCVAELDENNFATFFEYNEQGSLVRVKKETERGIFTIQESRNHLRK